MTRPHRREALLDANILIRILSDDPPEGAERADQFVKAAAARGIALVLTSLIVGEIVYVLGSYYQVGKRDIANQLIDLINTGTLVVPERDVVVQALEWYRDLPQVHFADAYIAAYALTRSDGAVASFDQQLRRVPGLTVLAGPADLPG